MEAEIIGFYLNGHPVEKYCTQYPDTIISTNVKKYRGKASVIAMIQSIKLHRTKTGQQMAFVDGQDEFGMVTLVFMPDTYSRYADIIKKGKVILANGTIDDKESLKVNNIKVLEGGFNNG